MSNPGEFNSRTIDQVAHDAAAAGGFLTEAGARRHTVSFAANGDVYIPADVAMTLDQGVAKIGVGTLTFAKSTAAAPGTFNTATLPVALEAGAWLKVTCASITGFCATQLKRVA